MSRLISFKMLSVAAIVTAGLLGFGNAKAEAGYPGQFVSSPYAAPLATCQSDYCAPPPCTYKTVIEWEFRRVEYVDFVTKYLPCGHAYRVKVLRTKLVKTPVERLVKVCY